MTETWLRLGIFAGVFILMSGLEAVFPRRMRVLSRSGRWLTNTAMLVLATLLVRAVAIAIPLLAASAAAGLAATLNVGLFIWLDWPIWLEFALTMILLDAAIWLQHLISHKVPLLWRIHRVHHADRDIDASTALRFHPVEILLSAAYKLGVILLLGPAVWAVIAFEIVLNASAMFNHANVALPQSVDRVLRTVIVTPDMHRVHHSTLREEHDRNYGFCLSLWDRLFRTYRDQPSRGHTGMTIGLPPYLGEPTQRLGWSLWLPFRR